jgi:peptidyl-prolyl cis-trans isomerase B (cyclophilin B)
MSTRVLPLLVVPVLAFTAAGCGSDTPQSAAGSSDSTEPTIDPDAATVECDYRESGVEPVKEVSPPDSTALAEGEIDVTVSTSVGDLSLTLDAENAPCTAHSFVSLVEQGWLDGTSCHRLTTQGIYVLQCGDPSGSGSGGPGYAFDDELTGKETYPAGTLAIANSGEDTNGSQFFIVYDDTQLPPLYTVLGTVDEASVETVQEVADAGTDEAYGPGNGQPLTEVSIESATVVGR